MNTKAIVTTGPPVRCDRESKHIAVVTIDRKARRNALNLEVKKLLADLIEQLSADESVRVIILTGANGIFVAGTDIDEMATMSPTQHTLLATDHLFRVLRHCRIPLIAAVEGYAYGGGCELALSCDIIIASEGARFGQPEIRVGIMPGAGGTQLLVRTIGKYRAMKMMLTGEPVTAADALSMGMVSELTQDGATLDRAQDCARSIVTMPPLAILAIKEAVRLGQDIPLETALSLERKAFQLLFDTADQKEGMRAFLEKRTPQYQGK